MFEIFIWKMIYNIAKIIEGILGICTLTLYTKSDLSMTFALELAKARLRNKK